MSVILAILTLCLTACQAERITIVLPNPIAASLPNAHVKRAVSGVLLNGTNFADPSIIKYNGVSYAFATRGNGYHIQMASDPDFTNPSGWKWQTSDALPNLPSWVMQNEVWAPDVAYLTDYDNSFGIYYAGRATINSKVVHCLSLARSKNIQGPYTDTSSEPWFINQNMTGGCQEDQGGQIDPSIFRDADGSWYVAYKLDGPATCYFGGGPYCHSTPIYLAKLGSNAQGQIDGYTLVKGDPWPLFLMDNNGSDDEYNIEAPALVNSDDGTHFMFFSRGSTYDGSYKVSYTYSTTGIKGPWNNTRTDLLATGSVASDGTKLYAPGGADITLLNSNMVFHADYNSTNGSIRAMHTGHLNWLSNHQVEVA